VTCCHVAARSWMVLETVSVKSSGPGYDQCAPADVMRAGHGGTGKGCHCPCPTWKRVPLLEDEGWDASRGHCLGHLEGGGRRLANRTRPPAVSTVFLPDYRETRPTWTWNTGQEQLLRVLVIP